MTPITRDRAAFAALTIIAAAPYLISGANWILAAIAVALIASGLGGKGAALRDQEAISHVWMTPRLQGFFACGVVACGHVSGL